MKKKVVKKPFFAKFLDKQLNKSGNVKGGIVDSTDKHPSDNDEDIDILI